MSDDDFDDDYDDDFDDEDGYEDNDDDSRSYSSSVENHKCGSCLYWASGSGRCFCSGKNNPHYYNTDHMDADDGCDFWEKHSGL